MSQHEQTLEQLLRSMKVMHRSDRKAIERRLSHLHRNYLRSRLREMSNPLTKDIPQPEEPKLEVTPADEGPDLSKFSRRLEQHLLFLQDKELHLQGAALATPATLELLEQTLAKVHESSSISAGSRPSVQNKEKKRSLFGMRRRRP